MPFGSGLLPNGQVRLAVFVGKQAPMEELVQAASLCFLVEVVGLLTPCFHKELGQLQVALILGDSIEPHQSQLDLLMAWVALFLVLLRAKDCINVIHKSCDHLEQFFFTRRFVVSYGSFNKVAGAVQLVVFCQVSPALFRLHDGVIGI